MKRVDYFWLVVYRVWNLKAAGAVAKIGSSLILNNHKHIYFAQIGETHCCFIKTIDSIFKYEQNKNVSSKYEPKTLIHLVEPNESSLYLVSDVAAVATPSVAGKNELRLRSRSSSDPVSPMS